MGRMVCEGSNGEPQPTVTEEYEGLTMVSAVWDDGKIGVSGREVPYTYSLALYDGIIACPKCRNAFKPLKSGMLPKHTRYVSWKEQQEMRGA